MQVPVNRMELKLEEMALLFIKKIR